MREDVLLEVGVFQSRRSVLGSVCLIALAMLAAFGAVRAHSAEAAAPATSVYLDGSPGDYILGGQTRTFTAANASFSTTANGTDFILSINGNGVGSGEFWTVWIAAPRGTLLEPGTYTGASRAAFRGGTQPGIDVFGDGRGCNQTAGQFIVEEAAYDASGTKLTSFAATFEQNCEIAGPPLFGEVRYNSAVPYRAIDVTGVSFPNVVVGSTSAPQSAVITNTGTDTLTVSNVALGGTNQGDFAILADDCSGLSLDPGSTCSVEVAFTPTDRAYRSAALVISDNTARGQHTLLLSGVGIAPLVALFSSNLWFGALEVGVASTSQSVTITNVGTAPLHVGTLTVTGPASAEFSTPTNGCEEPVQPQGSCVVTVVFTPAQPGMRVAALSISDDAQGSPHQVSLSGLGVAVADVGVSIGESTPFIRTGTVMTYSITIQNHGPDTAFGMTLKDSLPAGMTFVSVSTPHGTCTTPAVGQSGALVCSLGDLASGGVMSVTVRVVVTSPGKTTVSNSVMVSSDSSDFIAVNNEAMVSAKVHGRQ